MAQSKSEEKNSFKINPLSALFKVGSVFFEHKVAEKSSLQLGLAYTGLKIGDTKFSGVAVTPEYRYYPKGNAISGFYFGPFLRYQNFKVTVEEEGMESKGTYNSIGGGIVLGRQWVFGSGFTLDLFAGPSYNSGKYKATSGDDSADLKGGVDGFGIRPGITLGFAF